MNKIQAGTCTSTPATACTWEIVRRKKILLSNNLSIDWDHVHNWYMYVHFLYTSANEKWTRKEFFVVHALLCQTFLFTFTVHSSRIYYYTSINAHYIFFSSEPGAERMKFEETSFDRTLNSQMNFTSHMEIQSTKDIIWLSWCGYTYSINIESNCLLPRKCENISVGIVLYTNCAILM